MSDHSFRIERKEDGLYVVGRGYQIRVDNMAEAWRTIDTLLALNGHSSR
jgi:hypothetical protein